MADRPRGRLDPAVDRDAVRQAFAELQRSGDTDLRNELVEAHTDLAELYARRYRGRGIPDDDLHQVALLALVRAVDRFDPEVGVEFTTFASRTVDGELKRHLRDRSWSVRPPRRAQELHLEVRRTQDDLAHRLGRQPTVAEVAETIGETEDHVLEAMEAGGARRAGSIDAPVGEDGGERVVDRHLGGLDPDLASADVRVLIERLLDTLPERERLVLELRFFENRTQPEIAERIGVSQSYLSRLLRKTLLQLRDQMRS